MPGAGSSSYSVTTGPGLALTISPRTPKSPSTPSSARELVSSSLLLSGWRSEAFGAVSTETEGSSNLSEDLRGAASARPSCAGRGRRGLFLFFLVFLFVFVIFLRLRRQRRRRAAAEIGFLPFERGGAGLRRARDQRTIGRGHQPAEPRPSHSSAHDRPSPARPSCDRLLPRTARHRPRSASVLRRRAARTPAARRTGRGGHRREQDDAEHEIGR